MTTGRRTKLNNRGVSLVELVVVVLILGILAVGTAVSMSIVYNAKVSNAAKRLTSMLDRAREEAMAHITGTTYLEVKEEDGSVYARVFMQPKSGEAVQTVAEEKLGNTNITYTFYAYKDRDDSDEVPVSVEVSGTDEVRILYNPASGACYGLSKNEDSRPDVSEDAEEPVYYMPFNPSKSGRYHFTDVKIEGNETEWIMIIPETGRVLKNTEAVSRTEEPEG